MKYLTATINNNPCYSNTVIIILFFLILCQSCNFTTEEANREISKQSVNKIQISDTTSLIIKDSIYFAKPEIENEGRGNAFGNIDFGMQSNDVKRLNKNPQKLGKYIYNFEYFFNGEQKLYALILLSAPVKTILYEDVLQSNYSNLYNIISIKYGKPTGPNSIPSIFDVMNARTYWINKWQKSDKVIKLGIKNIKKYNFRLICKIVDIQMEKAEKKRLYNLKNKDMIKAADKF
jgi:hypothetical protein